jgi:hypothetical protein
MKRLPLAVVLLALLAIIALAVLAWMLLAPRKISAASDYLPAFSLW